jgi:hypothetical protein
MARTWPNQWIFQTEYPLLAQRLTKVDLRSPPLVANAASHLCAPFLVPMELNPKEDKPMIDVNRLPLKQHGGLTQLLNSIVDPHKPRGVRHLLATTVVVGGAFPSVPRCLEFAAFCARPPLPNGHNP